MQVEAASAAAGQERRPSYQAQTHVGVNRGSDLELLTGALFLFLRPERTVHIRAGLALGGSSLLAPTNFTKIIAYSPSLAYHQAVAWWYAGHHR